MFNIYSKVESWFNSYIRTLSRPIPENQRVFNLKSDHSFRVQELMQKIAIYEGLSRKQVELAKIIGLLHDIGRFPQYNEYGTFKDRISIDHGDFGAKILQSSPILHDFSKNDQNVILNAVKFHNKLEIDASLSDREKYFANMIRDADKIDIFYLVIPVYEDDPPDISDILKIDLPHTKKVSKNVLKIFFEQKSIDFSKLQSVDDFKIAQLAWLYDFNFKASLSIVQKYEYMKKLIFTLPETVDKLKLHSIVTHFYHNKI